MTVQIIIMATRRPDSDNAYAAYANVAVPIMVAAGGAFTGQYGRIDDLVGNDGPTHHGAYDLSYLGCIPNLIIMAPSDEIELKNMIRTAHGIDESPSVVRYPRGTGYGVEKVRPIYVR